MFPYLMDYVLKNILFVPLFRFLPDRCINQYVSIPLLSLSLIILSFQFSVLLPFSFCLSPFPPCRIAVNALPSPVFLIAMLIQLQSSVKSTLILMINVYLTRIWELTRSRSTSPLASIKSYLIITYHDVISQLLHSSEGVSL